MPQFGIITYFDWTPTCLDAEAAAGDVLAATETLTDFLRVTGGQAILVSLEVIDADDNGGDLDVVLLDTSVSIGDENGAPDITDANAKKILGIINVVSYVDLGGVKVATKTGLNICLRSTDSHDLYAGIITNTTATWDPAGLTLRFGLVHA